MTTRPRRAVIIGLDGANYLAIEPLLEQGGLPNLSRLIQEGTRCENAYAPYPTLTGSNWASIATGAWPGTHGVTDMSYHVTGEPIEYWHNGFTSDAVEAETLWESLARTDRKSIVLKYTGSWPPHRPDVTMIDGGGGRPFWGGSLLELSHSQVFSTEDLPNGNVIETAPARGWVSLPDSTLPPREFSIRYRAESGRIPEFLQFDGEPVSLSQPIHLWGLLYATGADGYNRVAICTNKDFAAVWTDLSEGETSDSLEISLTFENQARRGGLRIYLTDLGNRGESVTLYFSQVYPTDRFTQPANLGRELVEKFGAYINHPGFSAMSMGWFDAETFIRIMDYQNQWLGRAGRYLMESREWDLFAMQCHCIDFANHAFVPRHGWTERQTERSLERLARCYQSVDRMVGEILEGAGEDALVCVVSDHGATESPQPEVFVDQILEDAGLLVYEPSSEGQVRPDVDKSRTIAQQQRAAFIYVNLEGREPRGIVAPENYEQVRDQIIDVLRAYREPTTGRNPFSMILRKEDARILGLYDSMGRDIGDVVYALLPEFDHEHGRQLPGSTVGGQTMKPLLLFRGPGIKSGTVAERTAWLVDVVPTLTEVMEWPVPTEAEGAVLHQILSEHSSRFPRKEFLELQQKEMEVVRTRFERDREERGPEEQTARPGITSSSEVPEGPETDQEQPMPDTVEELKAALRETRREARKWKSAYEQYHRITHGN